MCLLKNTTDVSFASQQNPICLPYVKLQIVEIAQNSGEKERPPEMNEDQKTIEEKLYLRFISKLSIQFDEEKNAIKIAPTTYLCITLAW